MFHCLLLSVFLKYSATLLHQATLKPPAVSLFPVSLKIPLASLLLRRITFQHSLYLIIYQPLPAFLFVQLFPVSPKTAAVLQDPAWHKTWVLSPGCPSGPVMSLQVPACCRPPVTSLLLVDVIVSTLKCPGHILTHVFLITPSTGSPPWKTTRWHPPFILTCLIPVQQLRITPAPPQQPIQSTITLTTVPTCNELCSGGINFNELWNCSSSSFV